MFINHTWSSNKPKETNNPCCFEVVDISAKNCILHTNNKKIKKTRKKKRTRNQNWKKKYFWKLRTHYALTYFSECHVSNYVFPSLKPYFNKIIACIRLWNVTYAASLSNYVRNSKKNHEYPANLQMIRISQEIPRKVWRYG